MGNLHGGSFQAIQEYFQQKECRFCSHLFKSEGIQLLREEPGVLVVRVTCSTCGHPLGVAIVGTTPKPQKPAQLHPRDWTKRDRERLVGLPPITYDDVLNAHQFFKDLDTSWHQLLPKTGKAS
jgi:hypothetical protein